MVSRSLHLLHDCLLDSQFLYFFLKPFSLFLSLSLNKHYEVIFEFFINTFIASDSMGFPTVHEPVGVLLGDEGSLWDDFFGDDSDKFSVDDVFWRGTHYGLSLS